ncbi:MAG TPA: electron transfer flavoprotein-ubiquinone oxidoreductase [Acidobacteriota bacterium]|nr:electron transfer flavoprotein-ubiquinone oxidoreductase [Acidobacteriota bacterium]
MQQEREVLEVDVLFVGGGPASLAGAIHLADLFEKQGRKDANIVVIEKGREMGAHGISGAVMDPRGLRELIPNFLDEGAPVESEAREDDVYFMTSKGAMKFPVNPPFLNNHGNYIISLGKFVQWLAQKAEAKGVNVFTGFPGAELLIENGAIVGVRTGDKGIDKNGAAKGNYEPGIDIRAKVTILGEGPRGTLTKKIVNLWQMHGLNPQVYAVGIKEVWEVPEGNFATGKVIHTMGFPLTSETFGGGFIYGMANNLVSIGFVVGLDYKNPFLDPHSEFQKYKQHPMVAKILKGGKVVSYGAKSIPEGGWYSIPKLYANGLMMIGDSASFLNGQRLKGIHLAMKSGMLAAETAAEAIEKNDASEAVLSAYKDRVEKSWIRDELWKVRNFHQPYEKGFWIGMVHTALQFLTGGRGLIDPWKAKAGHEEMKKISEYYGSNPPNPFGLKVKEDKQLTFSKLTDVYFSGTVHEENQPVHLKVRDLNICHNQCVVEYGNPCQHFCPANVYEMVEEKPGEGKHLRINASNCVHCKTCDIMDPYGIIDWVTPEGGGGPNYKNL